jgi:hypothetical protein
MKKKEKNILKLYKLFTEDYCYLWENFVMNSIIPFQKEAKKLISILT